MHLHHEKHHAGYVAKLNEALSKYPELAEKPIEELLKNLSSVPDDIKIAVCNHGGGHFNHSFFWTILTPKKENSVPQNKLLDALIKTFSSLESFQSEFEKSALSLFGSGWTWLVSDSEKSNLKIINMPLQEAPLMNGQVPLLGIDVWEHAYYLKYQNKRAEYLKAIWNIIDWNVVSKKY